MIKFVLTSFLVLLATQGDTCQATNAGSRVSKDCEVSDQEISSRSEQKLRGDGIQICFEGEINKASAKEILSVKKRIGLFKISSPGGDVESAIKIAKRLKNDNSIVVIEENCFSSCANYIVPSAIVLYISNNATIAMHGSLPRDFATFSAMIDRKSFSEYSESHSGSKIDSWEKYKSGPLRSHIEFFDSIDVDANYADCFSDIVAGEKFINNRNVSWIIVDRSYASIFFDNIEYWNDEVYKNNNRKKIGPDNNSNTTIFASSALEFC